MRICLLGTLAVQDEAGRPVRVGGQRVRMLLILLALDCGRVVPAYSLIERLWGDEPPADASNSLQSLISRLRTALRNAGLGDGVIESYPAGYRLAVPPEAVDAVAFEALARKGSQALASGDAAAAGRILREALGTWRGPALADACDAEFAVGPAARLEELRVCATQDLIEAGLALGEGDSLIGELRAMVAADPLAERPRGLLMRALYAAGRQADALTVYQEARELLADRLGVSPSPQLEQLYLGVLRQDLAIGQPGSPAVTSADGRSRAGGARSSAERLARGASALRPRVVGMRKPLTSFVGRDEDVARVLKMLAEGRLVTLTGPGGAGKTRLAAESAALLAADAEIWGVWFVELAPVTDAAQVPYAVLDALGIRDRPALARAGAGQPGVRADPAERLVAALAERRAVLILDNCEHVVAAAAALADRILASCPDVRIVATSREPLQIIGEALWPVPPLPVPPPPAPSAADTPDRTALTGDASAAEVADYAAVRLLCDRAAAVRPGFRVDAANAAAVAWICRALDGMPLAIELAAARLRTLSAAQLAERLDARFVLLTGGSRTAVPRHQTLRAVVDWSWELLSEPEQVLARRLAVFAGGAALAAAEQVCQDGALPAEDILPVIFGLVDKSFLAVGGDADPRYRMLETVRAYCLERLAEAGEEEWVRRAFAAYFLQLAETADPRLRTGEQQASMRQLSAERDNIHAALRWAIDRREVATALRFGQALGWYWLLRGQRREIAALARGILEISAPEDGADVGDADFARTQARAICALIAAGSSWDLGAVRQPLAEAEAVVAPQGHGPGQGRGPGGDPPHPLAVVGVSMLAVHDRDPERAMELLAAHFGSADPWTRSGARAMHGFFSVAYGRVQDAASDYAGALDGFRAIGDGWGVAMTLAGQAELASLKGDQACAIATLEEAAKLGHAFSDWEDAAQIFASLARSRIRTGDYQRALDDLATAERAVCARGEPDADLWVEYIHAELAWMRGDLTETAGICAQIEGRMAGKTAVMHWPFRALVRTRGALADLRAGNPAKGRAALAAALRLAEDSRDRSAVAAVVDGVAAAVLETGGGHDNTERAATLLGAAHSIRGTFDHGSLDAPAARGAARRALGDAAFETAYRRGQSLGYAGALTLAAASVQPSGASGLAAVDADCQRSEDHKDPERP